MFVNPVSIGTFRNYYGKKSHHTAVLKSQPHVSFKGEDSFDYEARLKAELDKRSWFNKTFSNGKQEAKEAVLNQLIGYNINRETLEKEMKKRIDDKEALLKEKEDKIKTLEKNQQLTENALNMATANKEKDEIILSLKKQLEELKKTTNQEKLDYSKKVDELNKLKEEQEKITRREAGKGWNKIAGHKKLKTQLEEAFINKLAHEKAGYEVNIPNGILLYGQHGTGKTRFAEAFAQEADCNFVKIDTMQDNDDILDDIRTALKKAKKEYLSKDTPKKRTIILLDDFNSIAQLTEEEKEELEQKGYDFEDTTVGQLAEILEDCASKYKATIFMTTNHPKKIESELLNQNLIPYQIFLGPPNPNDAAQIFKYHTQGFTQQDIDYNKLGYKVARAIENTEAYSAQGIVNVVEHAKEKTKNAQITETDLLNAIDCVKPDITQKTFNSFLDDMADLLEETERVNGRSIE